MGYGRTRMLVGIGSSRLGMCCTCWTTTRSIFWTMTRSLPGFTTRGFASARARTDKYFLDDYVPIYTVRRERTCYLLYFAFLVAVLCCFSYYCTPSVHYFSSIDTYSPNSNIHSILELEALTCTRGL